MTDAMRVLYNYALENKFEVRLCTQEYRSADAPIKRLEDKLCQTLSGEATEHQLIELEAMFQAAFTLPRRSALVGTSGEIIQRNAKVVRQSQKSLKIRIALAFLVILIGTHRNSQLLRQFLLWNLSLFSQLFYSFRK